MKPVRNDQPSNQQMLVVWKRVSEEQSYVSKDKEKQTNYGSVWEKKIHCSHDFPTAKFYPKLNQLLKLV